MTLPAEHAHPDDAMVLSAADILLDEMAGGRNPSGTFYALHNVTSRIVDDALEIKISASQYVDNALGEGQTAEFERHVIRDGFSVLSRLGVILDDVNDVTLRNQEGQHTLAVHSMNFVDEKHMEHLGSDVILTIALDKLDMNRARTIVDEANAGAELQYAYSGRRDNPDRYPRLHVDNTKRFSKQYEKWREALHMLIVERGLNLRSDDVLPASPALADLKGEFNHELPVDVPRLGAENTRLLAQAWERMHKEALAKRLAEEERAMAAHQEVEVIPAQLYTLFSRLGLKLAPQAGDPPAIERQPNTSNHYTIRLAEPVAQQEIRRLSSRLDTIAQTIAKPEDTEMSYSSSLIVREKTTPRAQGWSFANLLRKQAPAEPLATTLDFIVQKGIMGDARQTMMMMQPTAPEMLALSTALATHEWPQISGAAHGQGRGK